MGELEISRKKIENFQHASFRAIVVRLIFLLKAGRTVAQLKVYEGMNHDFVLGSGGTYLDNVTKLSLQVSKLGS